jgi:transaldolase/glucose-6-phosphate isomerase
MTNRIQQLAQLGQSIWLDNIRRQMITSGQLTALVQQGLLGMTSNPTIFEKAIGGSHDYDETLQRLIETGATVEQIYDALTIEDVGLAADTFYPVFRHTNRVDGYVSIEVSPKLAHDTQATLDDARRLWKTLNRPNVMIKIPATSEGLPAIEEALFEGLNVNVTLMFSMKHYLAVTEAYLRALERRVAAGLRIDQIASVASFFVSRVDVLLDKELEKIVQAEGPNAGLAASLLGKAAVANSQLVYERYREIFGGDRFKRLAGMGAHLQRVLWASTSTKNPHYPDTLYVDTLIGPDTVNTVPPETLDAILDHTVVRRTVDADLDAARQVAAELATLGFDLNAVGEQLSVEGVDKFAKSFDGLLGVVADKRSSMLASSTEIGTAPEAAKKPAAKKSVAKKKPAAKKPATKKPAAKKPTAKRPATKKPAVKKPTVKKPATKKSAAKKPAAKKPAAKRPAKKTVAKKTAKKPAAKKSPSKKR